jgi:hypothetical protein
MSLDGSKNSLHRLDTAISFAKESDAMIVGVHSDTSYSEFSAGRTSKLKEEKWTNEIKGLMHVAQKNRKK